MSLSNTFNFNLTIDEIIRKAAQRAGGGVLDGEELKDALISLNLVFQDMMNNAIPLSLLVQLDIDLASGVQDHTLDSCINDLHHVVLSQTNRSDLGMSRYSLAEFNSISDKTTTGRPTVYTVERGYDAIKLRVWPIPDGSYTLRTYAFIKPDDAKRYTQHLRIQARYLPTIVAGLAVEIALDRHLYDKVPLLQQKYEYLLSSAQKEDRERVSYKITPQLNTRN